MNPWEWSSADILAGKMFVGGPMFAHYCPSCHSANIRKKGSLSNGSESIHCNDCGSTFGGASARA
jgi:predicted RNA-binding Zn-ribbon protein involved in translation (DUF1610 family)